MVDSPNYGQKKQVPIEWIFSGLFEFLNQKVKFSIAGFTDDFCSLRAVVDLAPCFRIVRHIADHVQIFSTPKTSSVLDKDQSFRLVFTTLLSF